MIVVIFALQKDNIIGEDYKMSKATIFHFASLFLFILGYIPFNPNIVHRSLKKKTIEISSKFFTLSYILIVVGLITSIITIGSILSPQEYILLLFKGGDGITDIRLQSGEGGLGGIFKMLNYSPLAIYLISSSYYNFIDFSEKDKSRLVKLKNVALIASVIKVLFSLDRLTILAILIVQVYEKVVVKKINAKLLIALPLIVFFLGFITSNRMSDSGTFGFLITYFKLSLVNYQLVIDHYDNWTFGWNTFLMPMYYILKFFGINKDIPVPDQWVWNPAQYFNSSFYMDFGIFSIPCFFLLGYIIRKIQIKAIDGHLFFTSIYFISLFAISTFISVPFIRGIEFWVSLVIAFVTSKIIIAK